MKIRTYLLLIAVTLLTACGSLGLPEAKSFDERLAYQYGNVTGYRNAATDLLAQGLIDKSRAQGMQDDADKARAGLDLARTAAKGGNPLDAENHLSTAILLLKTLKDSRNSGNKNGH